MNSLIICGVACGVLIFACWLLSVVTDEYSWVDRIWSIAPLVYIGAFAWFAGWLNPRANLMFALVVLWGARLTFNYARKGGYRKGGEDYRWAILRERMGPVKFQIFNATFIAPYQNILLLLLALPTMVASGGVAPFGVLDGLLAALFLLFLAGETVADQQQWSFHLRKRAGQTTLPFCDTGLFRYSRHPNFFCEVSMWWVMYAFSVVATGEWLTLALPGPVLLTLLFQGSTSFTERISSSKYPAYADYQRRTSRLIPMPPAK